MTVIAHTHTQNHLFFCNTQKTKHTVSHRPVPEGDSMFTE